MEFAKFDPSINYAELDAAEYIVVEDCGTQGTILLANERLAVAIATWLTADYAGPGTYTWWLGFGEAASIFINASPCYQPHINFFSFEVIILYGIWYCRVKHRHPANARDKLRFVIAYIIALYAKVYGGLFPGVFSVLAYMGVARAVCRPVGVSFIQFLRHFMLVWAKAEQHQDEDQKAEEEHESEEEPTDEEAQPREEEQQIWQHLELGQVAVECIHDDLLAGEQEADAESLALCRYNTQEEDEESLWTDGASRYGVPDDHAEKVADAILTSLSRGRICPKRREAQTPSVDLHHCIGCQEVQEAEHGMQSPCLALMGAKEAEEDDDVSFLWLDGISEDIASHCCPSFCDCTVAPMFKTHTGYVRKMKKVWRWLDSIEC